LSNIIKGKWKTENVVEIGTQFLQDSSPIVTMESITKLEAETRLLLENAKEQADSIISAAKLEVQQMHESTDKQIEEEKIEFEKQLKRREDELELQGADILFEAYQNSDDIQAEALTEKKQILDSIEGSVIDLLISLLGSIVSNEIAHSNKWIAFLVHKLLFGEDIDPNIEIGLSKAVYDRLTEDEIVEIESINKGAQVVRNARLSDYTIEISTDRGQIIYDPLDSLEELKKDLRLLSEVSHDFT